MFGSDLVYWYNLSVKVHNDLNASSDG
jgi:hypothetical protein